MSTGTGSLVVLWTSGDREVALKMVFMYTLNAKLRQWWEKVTLIVWGPSAKLLSEDGEIQAYVAEMKKAGVILEACVTCADMYGVSESLARMGFDVKKMGVPLTGYLKEGSAVLAL